ncbi:shikimate kinase [candidate division KSB1 bacterium]|nr:shikimate kinase [candidate division KSB1 bacterium]
MRNVYLLGFMGCGKSTIGLALAQRLRSPFADTDQEIVREAGLTIPEIFARHGEAYFRNLETVVIQRLSQQTDLVIALGGGSVLDPVNWERIQSSGISIYLDYPFEVIFQRVRNDHNRPLLAVPAAQLPAHLRQLMQQRDPYYRQAQVKLHLAGAESMNQIVNQIMASIEELNERYTG